MTSILAKPLKKPAAKRKPGSGTRVASQLAAKAGAGTLNASKPPKPKSQRPPAALPSADSERIARFAQEYLIDLNASAAYLRTGFKTKNPGSCAVDYMKRPEVVQAIMDAKAERAAREAAKPEGITQDLVLGVLRKMLTHDPRQMFDANGNLLSPQDMGDDTAMALTSFEVSEDKTAQGSVYGYTKKVKTSDRASAVTLAMRHLGMLNDKLNLNVGGQLTVLDVARLAVLTDEELEQLERITAKLQG